MPNNKKDIFDVDRLLNSLIKPTVESNSDTLKDYYERRLQDLKIPTSTALVILKMESRALNGIIEGTQKRADYTNLISIANFLQLPIEQVIQLYLQALENNFSDEIFTSSKKIEFIRDNFDLAALRKAGFIDSITDYEQIENRIVTFFGLKKIFDYKKPPIDVAFSAGLVKPKNELTRSFWIKAAKDSFEAINNNYEYDREALIKYFPEIRWHSTSVEIGLKNIMKELYKMGVTVIYQAALPSLHLRGATFNVNDKPCIVLTNYVGFYPTLWFALIHELFHVLFDWEEIKENNYHLSEDEADQLAVIVKEREADNFAREYLFSKEKSAKIKPYINDHEYIEEYALNNHVHPSFVYLFNAYDAGDKDRMAWARAKKRNPKIDNLINTLSNPWDSFKPIPDFIKSIEYKLYK